MAEAKNVTFDSIMADLKARKFVPLYYLMGEEPYYIDRIADYIAANVLQPEERDFNQSVLFGSDVTGAQIADYARRYPMMAEYQVLIVKEAQNVKQTEALEKYFKSPMPSTILVMCHKNGTVDGRKRDYVKAIQSAGVLFESKKLRDRDLPAFIEGYLKRRQVSIDPKSTQMIADNIGSDLSRLTGELDKVVLALPEDQKKVTPEVVEDQIGVSKEFNGYELRDAIVNRNVEKANRIMKYFCSNPKSGGPYVILPQLFSYFQNLMIAYYAPNKNNDQAMAQYLGLRSGWAARDYLTGLRNYSGRKVLEIISKIRETDSQIKGIGKGNATDSDLMQELVFFILH
jgi:DNA polymerase-3 subunit delta